MILTLSIFIAGIAIGAFARLPFTDGRIEKLQRENEILRGEAQREREWSASIQKDAIKKNVYLPRTTRAFSEAQ